MLSRDQKVFLLLDHFCSMPRSMIFSVNSHAKSGTLTRSHNPRPKPLGAVRHILMRAAEYPCFVHSLFA